jgi:hypothetical protein
VRQVFCSMHSLFHYHLYLWLFFSPRVEELGLSLTYDNYIQSMSRLFNDPSRIEVHFSWMSMKCLLVHHSPN